jgi:hypothetical protein
VSGAPATRSVALLGVCLTLAACGSGGSSSSTSTDTSTEGSASNDVVTSFHAPTPTPKPAGAPKAARPIGPRVGTTQRVKAQGTRLSITVTKVIDPLRKSGATLLAGTRAVGVFVRIVNDGPGGYDSSSTGDVSIVPSSGIASPAFSPRGQCMTPLQDFDNAIGPGENREGCVTLTLNTGATLVGERFSADGGGAGVATWRGPKS